MRSFGGWAIFLGIILLEFKIVYNTKKFIRECQEYSCKHSAQSLLNSRLALIYNKIIPHSVHGFNVPTELI